MPVKTRFVCAAAFVVAAAAACAAPGHVLESLPVAALACPAEVESGASFDVDGSESSGAGDGGAGALVEETLTVGTDSANALSGTFTAGAPGVVTARLVVVDGAGHTAEARCRIVVVAAAPVDPGVDAGPGDDVDPPRADISGRFVLVAYDRPVVEDSGLDPAQQCADAPVLGIVDFEQSDASASTPTVSMTLTMCAVVWPEVTAWFGVQQTTWTSAAVEGLPSLHADFARDGDAFEPAMDALGAGAVVGARVDDDAPLPTDADDPAVSDDDGDGWPAVTLRSSTYTEDIVYRRFLREMSGRIVDADYVTGTWRADAEASLVSWSDFAVPAGLGRPSAFRLTRVDDATTCADVRLDADALLAAFPAPATDDCPPRWC